MKRNLFAFVIAATALASCGRNPNDPGTEYAPDMYHSVALEPFSQITDSTIGLWRSDRRDGKGYFNSSTVNPHFKDSRGRDVGYGMNMRYPAKNTIARRNYQTKFGEGDSAVVDLMVYNIHPDSMALSEKLLVNPVPLTHKTLKEGEEL
jgi:hypothetical protein